MKKTKKFKFLLAGVALSTTVTVLSASVAASCSKVDQAKKVPEKTPSAESKKDYVKHLTFYKTELTTVLSETKKLVKQYDNNGKTGVENLATSLKETVDKEISKIDKMLKKHEKTELLSPSVYDADLKRYNELGDKEQLTSEEEAEFNKLEQKFTPLSKEQFDKLKALSGKETKTEAETKELKELEDLAALKLKYQTAEEFKTLITKTESNYKTILSTLDTLIKDISSVSSSSIQTVIDRKTYAYEYNSVRNLNGFDYDGSSTYGTEQNTSPFTQTALKLIRVKPLNESVVKKEPGKDLKVVTTVIKPSFWKYSLEAVEAVILTTQDGQVKVYDNDDVEDLDKQTDSKNDDGTFNSLYVQAFSNKENSINSKEFLNNLNDVYKMQLVIRKTPWVTANGEKTKYVTKADDFYYSWMRTVLNSQRYRLKHGSDETLEKEMNSLLPSGSKKFTSSDDYPNEYIFELYNVNSEDFYKRDKFITEVSGENKYKGQEALTFSQIDKETPILGRELLNAFSDSTEFLAAPSDYIKDVTKDKNMNIVSYTEKSVDTLLPKIKEDEFLKTEVGQFGVFWYGMNAVENTLYAGPYYAEGFKTLKEVFKQNPHYFDQEWVKSPNSIKTIENLHQQQPVDANIFDQRQWAKYRQGTITRIAYSSLDQSAKNTINANPNEYGLRTSQSLNKTTSVSRVYLQPVPASFKVLEIPEGTKPENYYSFNEAYAKLMWGGTLEEISKGELKDIDTYLAGTGLQFRTLVAAAVNWTKYADALTAQQARPYLAHLAPDASIAGKDQTNSKYKTPRDAYEEINSLFALDNNLNKVDFGGSLGYEISPQENLIAFGTQGQEQQQFKSAGFEVIKKQMKDLLDKFYEENPQFAGQKIKFKFFFPYVNPSDKYLQSTNNAIEIIKALDERIETELFTPTNAAEYYQIIYGSGTNFAGWGYDLDTIGSGFDAFSWQGALIPQLYILGQSESLQNKLKNAFPKMVAAAKELVQYTEEKVKENKLAFEAGFAPENYKTLITKHGINLINLLDHKQGTLSGTYSAQFWTHFIRNKTNEELIQLAKEFSNYISPIEFDHNQTIAKEKFAPFLLHKGYEAPIQPSGFEHYADWKIKL